MAKLDPSGIVNGSPVLAAHVKQIIDAFTAESTFELSLNGTFDVTGSIDATQNITASYFSGNGINLTGVITDRLSSSFTTTASFNSFSSSYYTDSASFATRINANGNAIINNTSNINSNSSSFATRLASATSSIVANSSSIAYLSQSIDNIVDVQTAGVGYDALDGNVLVYDTAVSLWRPSRNNVNVNITGSFDVAGTSSLQYLDLNNTTVTGSSVTSVFGLVSSVAVTHSLNVDFPIVQVYTASNRSQIIPTSIVSVDANRILVDFAIPTSGSIVIHK